MKTQFYIGETKFDEKTTYVVSEDHLNLYKWYKQTIKSAGKGKRTSNNAKVQKFYDRFDAGIATLKQILEHKNYELGLN